MRRGPRWSEASSPPRPPRSRNRSGDAPCFDDFRRPLRNVRGASASPGCDHRWPGRGAERCSFPELGGRRVQRAWRTTALVAGAAGASAQRAARTGVARLVAALTLRRVGRRRVVFALMGAIVAAGLTAGGVAFRKSGLTNGATAEGTSRQWPGHCRGGARRLLRISGGSSTKRAFVGRCSGTACRRREPRAARASKTCFGLHPHLARWSPRSWIARPTGPANPEPLRSAPAGRCSVAEPLQESGSSRTRPGLVQASTRRTSP